MIENRSFFLQISNLSSTISIVRFIYYSWKEMGQTYSDGCVMYQHFYQECGKQYTGYDHATCTFGRMGLRIKDGAEHLDIERLLKWLEWYAVNKAEFAKFEKEAWNCQRKATNLDVGFRKEFYNFRDCMWKLKSSLTKAFQCEFSFF